jgi:peptidoglycan/LPS O-acetylase OafA/YrhL
MGLIRILLALFVVFYHCGGIFGIETMPGNVAVELFFIISGFYMALILNEKYIGAKGNYSLFITNRFIRLYPIYFVVLILSICTAFFYAFASSFTNYGQLNFFIANWDKLNFFSKCYLLFVNVSIVGQDFVLFLGLDPTTGSLAFTKNYAFSSVQLHQFLIIPQAWSIGIEIMFYLIAPFILRRSSLFLLLIALLSFSVKWYLPKIGLINDPWTYRFFPAELLFFCLGAMAYKGYVGLKKIKIPPYFNLFVFIITIVVLLMYNHLHYYIRQYLLFVGFAIALPFIFILSKRSKLDREIGELSYPVYISHVYFKTILYEFFSSTWIAAICATASIVFSFFANHFISKRIEIYRQKRFENNALLQTSS